MARRHLENGSTPRRFPSALCALFVVLVTGPRLGAHDPGLSFLEVRVAADRIVAELSLAVGDAQAVVDLSGTNGRRATDAAQVATQLGVFALEATVLRIDGRPLLGTIDSSVVENDAVRLRLRYERVSGAQLEVASAILTRLAPGHQQLLSVRADDALIGERLLSAGDHKASVELIAAPPASVKTVLRFFGMGVRHILAGYDHLLFLAALLVPLRGRDVLMVVTAFTAAHSVTLVFAVFGVVRVSPAIVEPLIAASIVIVALQNLLRPADPARWKPAFGFGLVHGLGFAEALREIGIGSGSGSVVVPLASFNVGVEAGQLAIAALFLPLVWALKTQPVLRARLAPGCSVLVLLAGAYWLIERTLL